MCTFMCVHCRGGCVGGVTAALGLGLGLGGEGAGGMPAARSGASTRWVVTIYHVKCLIN